MFARLFQRKEVSSGGDSGSCTCVACWGGRAATVDYPISGNNVTAELVAKGAEAWSRVKQSKSILLLDRSYSER